MAVTNARVEALHYFKSLEMLGYERPPLQIRVWNLSLGRHVLSQTCHKISRIGLV
ncbi:hypothetical protein Pla144_34810 [Bythopirellula polymerisocia]|uniref:Uncharacterized protein n=1 Tax=Bythopirellula polymerisocia TaxID=2528003 RepID=A0A5C6CNH2_9BACT|nr:hypothetical protein Pla144_34810 [Bythopirellula polymerisocia]